MQLIMNSVVTKLVSKSYLIQYYCDRLSLCSIYIPESDKTVISLIV